MTRESVARAKFRNRSFCKAASYEIKWRQDYIEKKPRKKTPYFWAAYDHRRFFERMELRNEVVVNLDRLG